MGWQVKKRHIQLSLFPEKYSDSDSPELTVLSYGAGQDSTALLYQLGRDASFRKVFAPGSLIVIFSDTGAEHHETYEETLADAMQFCETHGISFFWLKPGSRYHSKAWPGLIERYRATSTCGSRGFPRSCTDQLKIRPIYRFLEAYLHENYGFECHRKKGFYQYAQKYGKLRVLIGLSVEESGRCAERSRPPWMRRTIEIRYPLQEIGATRADAQQMIREWGYRVPMPSSCRCCPFLTLRDLLWKYRTRRHEFDELKDLETHKLKKWQHLASKNYGIFGSIHLDEALKQAEYKFGHLSDEALVQARYTEGHAVKSTY